MLPVSDCRNQLERIAIDFEKEKLADKLAPWANRPDIIFIIEGVFMYLSKDEKEALLKTLTMLFPKHILFCDLMNKNFFERFGKDIHKKFVEYGAAFSDITIEPEQLFLLHGYNKTTVTSIPRTANDLGLIHIPKFILNVLLRKMMMGCSVYSFTYAA